ncbi:dUTP diphosphatase [Faecalibaculum rodentium]|uniref:dUTP diphosphatase n=1 Tax=Faecalibaculum rodentium TaxID=1702221 RepID=UPI0025B765D5|nr:dUTP diphosphatase [Faecalibaculum rodentium]
MTELMERKAFITRWRKMLKLQEKLDERIVMGNGLTYKDLLDGDWYVSAVLDEIGELNHELKADWCWWKKTQAPVDEKKVLEEFVDVLHFVLSWQLAHHEVSGLPLSKFTAIAFSEYENSGRFPEHRRVVPAFQPMMLRLSECNTYPPVSQLMWLMRCLKLDFEDVYQAYLAKNKVNHQRQNRGY